MIRAILPLLLLLSSFATVLPAQEARGTGQQASPVFALAEGLAVFELVHEGEGEFVVRLLDERGGVVELLARAAGPVQLSKAVQIPARGYYLYDVSATGDWRIGLRSTVPAPARAPGESEFEVGRREGEQAVRESGAGRWFAAGLVGGLTLGPVGTGAAMALSARGVEAPHEIEFELLSRSIDFSQGYREGFRARMIRDRRTAALFGGITGTSVLTALIIHFMGQSSGGGSGTPPGPPGTGA
jgi:hypothetical protein